MSDDGKTVAFGIENNRRWTVSWGDQKSEEVEGLRSLALSRDGKRLAYPAKVGDKWSLVVDGVKGEPFDSVSDTTWSADGSVVACIAANGTPVEDFPDMIRGTYTVVVNGKRGENYSMVRDLVLSRDGKRLIFAARRKTGWTVVADGKPGQEFDNVSYLALSGDGKTFAYVGTQDRKAWLVTNGVPLDPGFGGVGMLAFGTGEETLAYMACETYSFQFSPGLSRDFIVWKGRKARSPFVRVEQFAPSPDGSAVFISNGNSVAVGGSVAGPFRKAGPPVFSEDGKTVSVGVLEDDAFVWKTYPLGGSTRSADRRPSSSRPRRPAIP